MDDRHLTSLLERTYPSGPVPPLERVEQRAVTIRRRRRTRLAASAVTAAAIVIVAVVATLPGGGGGSVQTPLTTPPTAPTAPTAPPTTVPDTGSGMPVPDQGPTVENVTVGGPGLVAVGWEIKNGGADAVVWTSVDGAIWSRVPQDEALAGPGHEVMFDVTAGGPGLVAVGRDSKAVGSEDYGIAAVWTSVDGVTWSRVTHDDAVFGRATGSPDDVFNMNAVTVGGPGLVAVGGRGGVSDRVYNSGAWIGKRPVGAVWTSVDGLTWSRVPDDPAVFGNWPTTSPGSEPLGWGLSASMRDVTPGGPGLVIVGRVYPGGVGTERGAAWTSSDGVTWSLADDQIEASLDGVAAGGPGFVAVGIASERTTAPFDGPWMVDVWTSTDGVTWSRVPPQPEVLGGIDLQSVSITVGGPGLVAVGEFGQQAWTSADGITWSRVDIGTLGGRDPIEALLRVYAFGRE